ncbi:SPASM domain-containing protein [Nanoarchaeota archaeon]
MPNKIDTRNFEDIEECIDCEYTNMCFGGCPYLAYKSGDLYGKDPFCESYKMIFGHIKNRLKEENFGNINSKT